MKPKGVTTQMKALDGYILMVLIMLLLKRVHVLLFANFMFNLSRETWQCNEYSHCLVVFASLCFYSWFAWTYVSVCMSISLYLCACSDVREPAVL